MRFQYPFLISVCIIASAAICCTQATAAESTYIQTGTVTGHNIGIAEGTVRDRVGPVAGATVVSGGGEWCTTDPDGNFSIVGI